MLRLCCGKTGGHLQRAEHFCSAKPVSSETIMCLRRGIVEQHVVHKHTFQRQAEGSGNSAPRPADIVICAPPPFIYFFSFILSGQNWVNMRARMSLGLFVAGTITLLQILCVFGALFLTIRVHLSSAAAVFLCAVPRACCLWKQLRTAIAERGS